jgi:hypothetical protein
VVAWDEVLEAIQDMELLSFAGELQAPVVLEGEACLLETPWVAEVGHILPIIVSKGAHLGERHRPDLRVPSSMPSHQGRVSHNSPLTAGAG